MQTYFNTHSHTEYSNLRILDSINTPEALIKKAISMGLSGIAITDHETLASHVKVAQIASKVKEEHPDFTIALGNEIYLTNDRRSGQRQYHFILMAKNFQGLKALRELSSQSWYYSYMDKMTRVPTLKSELKDILSKPEYKGTVIGTTACLGGELACLVSELVAREKTGNKLGAQEIKGEIAEFIRFQKEVFGDDFYIEVAPSDTEDQLRFNTRIKAIADFFNVKIVVGTDAHYLRPEDRDVHRAYLNAKEGEREVDDFYSHSFLMTPAEVHELLSKAFSESEAQEIMDNTLEIKGKIEHYSIGESQRIPRVPVEEYGKIELEGYPLLTKLGQSDDVQDRYWVNKCLEALEEKGLSNEEYLSRLEEEADVIDYISGKLGDNLTSYFNTLKSYIDLFWECGSIVGPGRGSAVGFLSNFLLSVTQVDPVKHNLPAFRFLNKERVELPDIDFDLAPSKRKLIFEKIREKIGEKNLLQVATFSTEGTRSAILTAARGYRSKEYPNGVDIDDAHYMTSLIPVHRGFLWPIKDVVYGNPEEDRQPVHEFVREMGKYPGLLDIVMHIEGLVCGRGVHAAGIIFYDNDAVTKSAIMKSPGGELTTQYSLGDEEFLGGLKYDALLTKVSDKILACIDFLQKDEILPKDASIREIYEEYLHPDALPLDDDRIWNGIGNGEILDVFQFATGVGRQAAMQIKPRNLDELTSANSLMRLMGEKGEETPLERYTRIKKNPFAWRQEAMNYGLNEKEINVLAKYYDQQYGTPAFQEDIMIICMDEEVAGFSLKEVNDIRKIIGKKLMDKIPEVKEELFKRACSQEVARYIWDTLMAPQMGYSFSSLHSLAYSFVGVQTAYLGTCFPTVYWNTACLAVNSGSDVEEDEGKATDYSKIAKALGEIISTGTQISLLNINSSDFGFKPVQETNSIRFGLRGVNKVGTDLVHMIIENRPYESMADFLTKVAPNRAAMVSLIKGGAFDELEKVSRVEIMKKYIWSAMGRKKTVTMAQVPTLIELGLLPEKYDMQRRIYNFNKYLKDKCKSGNYFKFDDIAYKFFSQVFDEDELEIIGNKPSIRERDWARLYDKNVAVLRDWIKENKETLVQHLNIDLFKSEWTKYAKGTVASWEMESLCFYHSEHELAHVNINQYGISNFGDLPETPEVDYTFQKGGKTIPIYKLSKIIGTCVGKDKSKSTISLLTTDGVVDIRFRGAYFSLFDKQVSESNGDGTKSIKEKSWFTRGNLLMITGFRSGEQFVPKKYAKTPSHMLYKIEEVDKDGNISLTSQRYGQGGEN